MKTLMIVDMQNGFITDNNRFLIAEINNLIKSNKFDRIVVTQFVNNEKTQFFQSLNWKEMLSSPDIDFAVNIPKNSHIIKKDSYGLPINMFDKKGLKIDENLILPRDEQIFICGTDYDACILAIGYQLFDQGFTPIFIEKCIGSASKNPVDKDVVEKIMKRNFGKHSIEIEEDLKIE